MRKAPIVRVEPYRVAGEPNTEYGAFLIPILAGFPKYLPPTGYKVICSDGGGWDHLSVSLPTRTPRWEEMDHIKRLFFRDDEWAIQYHPSIKDYKNLHPYCLHIWRPQTQEEMDTIKLHWAKVGEPLMLFPEHAPGAIQKPPLILV
jgi:hypothetical protein